MKRRAKPTLRVNSDAPSFMYRVDAAAHACMLANRITLAMTVFEHPDFGWSVCEATLFSYHPDNLRAARKIYATYLPDNYFGSLTMKLERCTCSAIQATTKTPRRGCPRHWKA